MLSRRYTEEKPASERRWMSSIDKWLKKVNGYTILSTGPTTPPARIQRRIKSSSDNVNVSSNPKRSSSARPVVIVERMRNSYQLDEMKQPQPVINLNDHFIEVYYCSKTNLNDAGQLERYSRNANNKLCYCCDECVACKNDRNANDLQKRSASAYSRHRPLNQVQSKNVETVEVSLNDKRKYQTKLKPHHSFNT